MEPLFEVETEYTLEKYAKYIKTAGKNATIMLFVFVIAIIVLLNIFWLAVFYTLFPILYTIILIALGLAEYVLIMTFKTKKAWNTNKAMHGMVNHYLLYEDRIEQVNSLGTVSVKYDQLYRIFENKSAFYLMVANNQGILIDKEKCSAELLKFLEELKSRYSKR